MEQIYGKGRQTITLAELRKADETRLVILILAEINNALIWYGAENDITNDAGAMLASNIITTFYYFSVEDIHLAIKRKLSEHKYGKLSANDIYSWFVEYDEYRANNVSSVSPPDEKPLKLVPNGYENYIKELQEKADAGDEEAKYVLERNKERLARHSNPLNDLRQYEKHKQDLYNKRYNGNNNRSR